MTQGRSIRLFLVDGTPNGLLTAEIMNWTGHVLTGPRSKLSELVQRPEVCRTGIYFLIGPDPENSFRSQVYIGESDDVGKRLKQHNRPEEQNGKDFWEKVCLVTSKDQNLTKAHVKYLESQLIGRAKQVGRCTVLNGTAHDYTSLPEADLADMAFFIEQIRTVLPVLGFDFMRDVTRPAAVQQPDVTVPPSESPRFILEMPSNGLKASAQEIDGEFFVLAGSQAREDWIGTDSGYKTLYKQLSEEGVINGEPGKLKTFTVDYSFSSPSAAAAVVAGRAANGRTKWTVVGSGQTYAEWQDYMVNTSEGGAPTEPGNR